MDCVFQEKNEPVSVRVLICIVTLRGSNFLCAAPDKTFRSVVISCEKRTNRVTETRPPLHKGRGRAVQKGHISISMAAGGTQLISIKSLMGQRKTVMQLKQTHGCLAGTNF
jgi:hypothetical protein